MHYGPVVALHKANFSVERGEVVGVARAQWRRQVDHDENLHHLFVSHCRHGNGGRRERVGQPAGGAQTHWLFPRDFAAVPEMEVRDLSGFCRPCPRSCDGQLCNQRLDWVVDRCGLKPMFRKLVRELSKGYRQRVGLAQALIHDPQVVILDEPTSGLDPHQILEIRQLIRELSHDKTVLLSTHILQEIEAVADRIVIINSRAHRGRRHVARTADAHATRRSVPAGRGGGSRKRLNRNCENCPRFSMSAVHARSDGDGSL